MNLRRYPLTKLSCYHKNPVTMQTWLWHHAQSKLYCNHGNSLATHSLTHSLNGIIQTIHFKGKLALPESLPGTAWFTSSSFIALNSVTMHHLRITAPNTPWGTERVPDVQNGVNSATFNRQRNVATQRNSQHDRSSTEKRIRILQQDGFYLRQPSNRTARFYIMYSCLKTVLQTETCSAVV
jgi:hypothetical protein